MCNLELFSKITIKPSYTIQYSLKTRLTQCMTLGKLFTGQQTSYVGMYYTTDTTELVDLPHNIASYCAYNRHYIHQKLYIQQKAHKINTQYCQPQKITLRVKGMISLEAFEIQY